jgi:cytochrome c oxidase subunit II
MNDGSTVVADEAYIRESIVDPGAKRVAGYNVTMPTIPMSDQEVEDLVAYIITLE